MFSRLWETGLRMWEKGVFPLSFRLSSLYFSLPFFSPPLSSVSFDFFFLIWIPFQKCQDYLRFAPNQTQTPAGAGNQENFTKNLPDQQNTPPFHFSTGRVSELGEKGESCAWAGESFETLHIIVNHFRMGGLGT